ncbi:MAG TPA: hypothetical protein VF045_05125 [Acidimicrobiales bacterium]
MQSGRRAVGGFGVAAMVAALLVAVVPVAATAVPAWAPATTATIHPGVMVTSPAGQCTANFVFYDSDDVFIGQAAHCTSTGGPTDTDGCLASSLPLGTPITIGGASQPGTLAYNSWIAMAERGETDADACAHNDFALVRIDPADVARVNPSVPHWGGPVALATAGTLTGQKVYSYGNSSLRLGLTLLSPKVGISLGDSAGGWNTTAYTLTPGIPGDSGSGFLDRSGRALGVLSTVQLLPLPAANGVGNLRLELEYLNGEAHDPVRLASGTEPFRPNQLPLGL